MNVTKSLLVLTFTAVSWAQLTPRMASITAVGEATISVPPDLARVDLGVTTQATTAQDATNQNATQSSAVIAAIQAVIGNSGNIKTISYSLNAVYNNPPPGQTATIVAYQVSNVVEVTLNDLTAIGKVIDTSIQNGANRVQGISFGLQDSNPPTAQALRTAAARSKTQADAIAAGLNVHTGAVLHASEGVNTTTPTLRTGVAATTTTPVETGLVVIQASVTLEVAIAQ